MDTCTVLCKNTIGTEREGERARVGASSSSSSSTSTSKLSAKTRDAGQAGGSYQQQAQGRGWHVGGQAGAGVGGRRELQSGAGAEKLWLFQGSTTSRVRKAGRLSRLQSS